jgi:hypothetical protein
VIPQYQDMTDGEKLKLLLEDDEIQAVTREEIQRVAKAYLHPKDYILVVVGNLKEAGMEWNSPRSPPTFLFFQSPVNAIRAPKYHPSLFFISRTKGRIRIIIIVRRAKTSLNETNGGLFHELLIDDIQAPLAGKSRRESSFLQRL